MRFVRSRMSQEAVCDQLWHTRAQVLRYWAYHVLVILKRRSIDESSDGNGITWMGLTGGAPPASRAQIIDGLLMQNPVTVIGSLVRQDLRCAHSGNPRTRLDSERRLIEDRKSVV